MGKHDPKMDGRRSEVDAYGVMRLRVKAIEWRVGAIEQGSTLIDPRPVVSDAYLAAAILDLLTRLQHAEAEIAELKAGALK